MQQDEPTDAAKLHRVIADSFTQSEHETPIAYRDGENSADLIALGISLLELYLKEPPPDHIIGIEQEILAPLHNSRGEYLETPLLAIADLITEGNEELTVQEFKTSGRAYSEMEAETSLQPTCYVNAVQEMFGSPATVEYTVLVKTKTPKIQRLKAVHHENDLARLGDIVENIERAIEANVFYPVENPLNCSTCPFRQPCREWGRKEHTELVQLNIKTAGAMTC
ncbi:DNA helicase II [Fimbriiglobus ruber]|uniref:DNA helicase II n=1 Tax=Fimbriiglobus ruber TaxID=1908690 RepID=A0A225CZM4_9BACT|nr:DNA helicase II [Fimbriiglobus ruber]